MTAAAAQAPVAPSLDIGANPSRLPVMETANPIDDRSRARYGDSIVRIGLG